MISTRPCRFCGHANTPHARFCSNCGKPLPEPTRTPSVPATPAPSSTGQHPVVEQRVEKALGTVIGVLQGSIGAVHITPTAAIEVTRMPRHQIQPVGEDYISRKAIEDRLTTLLTDSPNHFRLVELYGPPGSGKSIVGRKVASDLAAQFPDARLWVEVGNRSELDLLWSLIDPFEEPPERSPTRDEAQYRAVLNRALGNLRVLIVLNRVNAENQELVRRILPVRASQTAVLIISDSHLPELVDDENSVALPEMSAEEACCLFRMIWKDAYRSTPDEVVVQLAAEFNFLPTQISLAARDILNHQIAPAEYLRDLQQQKANRPYTAANVSGFQAVYDNLPEQSRRILPFIGVMGGSPWTSLALAAVAQAPLAEVETGLRQLRRVGFISTAADQRYTCSPAGRDFALSRLHDIGGEALVRSARSVQAYQTLRAAEEITMLRRQSILKDFLLDDARKKRFLSALRQSFLPDEQGKAHGDTGAMQATPGLGDYDIVQDAFEEVVLANHEYLQRWQHWINSSLCVDQARSMEEALRWAIMQENWALVRSFYNSSIGVYIPELTAEGEKERKENLTAVGFRFGAIRNLRLNYVNLETTFYGVRVINPHITHTELVGAYWGGVRLHRPEMTSVDMVNAGMPGLVVQDGILSGVDFRGADLRGAVFFNCHFTRVNFRNADLRQARFLGCGGTDIDLRAAQLEGVGFHNCVFAKVVYYKSDSEHLPLKSETTQLN